METETWRWLGLTGASNLGPRCLFDALASCSRQMWSEFTYLTLHIKKLCYKKRKKERKKYRPMEQDRKPRDKPTHLWTPYLWQRRQE